MDPKLWSIAGDLPRSRIRKSERLETGKIIRQISELEREGIKIHT
jgi:hypothetical protein